ncbi:MAG: SGNH/GDSL hydrolase family protein [Alphaproteobacteria bacterium]|nr:SGNH/GDSL hydrolase family protein [Alphaproteobacteria bacterium]
MMIKCIGAIGDSITHGFYDDQNLGWFTRLGQMILAEHSGEYVFNNMSQAGDTIADAVHRSLYEVLSRHFDLIIVNIGINDLRRRKNSDMQLDFSEGRRAEYWQQLLTVLQKTGAKIVVTDLLPVVESRYTPEATLLRRNSDVECYNRQIKELCGQNNIPFFERYPDWKDRNIESLYKDALHPNTQGHQLIARQMFDFLKAENLI